ncbi:hypothetical protein GGR56DRAFT_646650 [Xylariaceae sp. FL0804]|nr:hypothetical protein GGR56DRAFT_646650 [Xylariaceae sp. FL0804]
MFLKDTMSYDIAPNSYYRTTPLSLKSVSLPLTVWLHCLSATDATSAGIHGCWLMGNLAEYFVPAESFLRYPRALRGPNAVSARLARCSALVSYYSENLRMSIYVSVWDRDLSRFNEPCLPACFRIKMPWQKVSESRWERPVDGIEGYFVVMGGFSASLCDGRVHYTLFSKLQLETAQPEAELVPALKQAWKQYRYEEPQIAVFVEDSKLTYEVPDQGALAEWLEATLVVSPASDAEELYATAAPVKQATLYYVPKSSELVFRAPHYILDGNGILRFWHNYLGYLASPSQKEDIEYGDEPARLALPMDEVLGYPAEATAAQTELATAKFMAWAGSIPGIGPPSQVGTAPSGRCASRELSFPASTTERLVAACKARGVSVTAAVHAAFVGSLVRYADPNGQLSEYVTATNFNLRKFLPAPDRERAVAVFYTPWSYKTGLPAAFGDLAASLSEYYRTEFNEHPEHLSARGPFTRIVTATVQTPEFLAAPVPRDALVSSLGVVENHLQREYGSIKVKDFKIGVDVVLGMSMFFVYTFRGQLRFAHSFNDGFEKPEDIEMYLEETKAILMRELLG